MPSLITSTVRFAHQVIRDIVRPGDVVVDATAGNGNDTVLLAHIVGDEGHVHAFDIQAQALAVTQQRLVKDGVAHRAHLHRTGHEYMKKTLSQRHTRRVRAVMFNLGFLPGSDKTLTTQAETTRAALNDALYLLAPGGVITAVCYTGHPGGEEEELAVRDLCDGLSLNTHKVVRYELVNKLAKPVVLYCIQFSSGHGED